jgi:hypothetical protein
MEQVLKDSHGHYRRGNSVYGECEACDKTDVEITVHYGSMWFCADCWESEVKHKEANIVEVQQVNTLHKVEHNVLEASRVLDSAVNVRQDIFNAATIAIVDIEKAIDDDASITNKPYAKSEMIMERWRHFQEVGIKQREALLETENIIKAHQVRMLGMANTLRAEEREKLKISDINYNPSKVKSIKTVKSISTKGTTKKPKISKEEIRKVASELGMSEFTVTMIVTQKGTLEEAKAHLIKMLESAKTAQSNQSQ